MRLGISMTCFSFANVLRARKFFWICDAMCVGPLCGLAPEEPGRKRSGYVLAERRTEPERPRDQKDRKDKAADPQPIPAHRIECGFGSSCLRMRRPRAFSSTYAWIRTAQTGAAYSTPAANGREKSAASDRAKISLREVRTRTPGHGTPTKARIDLRRIVCTRISRQLREAIVAF